MGGSVFDQVFNQLIADAPRRLVLGVTLLALAAVMLAWVESRVCCGESLRAHWNPLRFGVLLTPFGIALILSAPWGLLGPAVFFVVAMVAGGVGVAVMLVRQQP